MSNKIIIGGDTFYHGDCLEVMENLPENSADMILCDLPYGTTACSWDVVIPFEPLWHQYKIEQDADKIIFLWKPSKDTDDLTVNVNVAKNRNGPTGQTELIFQKKYTRFEEKEGGF